MKLVKQSLLIFASFVIVFAWQQTFLAGYTIHALVLLTVSYLILTARKKEFSLLKKTGDSVSIFILMTMILLLVFSTGGLTSTLFFLLYFLTFGITFAFEPISVFVFIILATLVFLPSATSDDTFANFLHIGSLYLVAPFAFVFGREFKKEQQEEKRSKKVTKTKRRKNTSRKKRK